MQCGPRTGTASEAERGQARASVVYRGLGVGVAWAMRYYCSDCCPLLIVDVSFLLHRHLCIVCRSIVSRSRRFGRPGTLLQTRFRGWESASVLLCIDPRTFIPVSISPEETSIDLKSRSLGQSESPRRIVKKRTSSIVSCESITDIKSSSSPTTPLSPTHTTAVMVSLLDLLHQKLEIFRLEQRYTKRRNRRSTFVSEAQYVDGEYIYSPTSTYSAKCSAGSSSDTEVSVSESGSKESKVSRRLSKIGLDKVDWRRGRTENRESRVSVMEVRWDSSVRS